MTPLVEDFAGIAAALREIKDKPEAKPACSKCEGGGWECYWFGYGGPHFRVCAECGNPDGLPSP